MLVSNCEGPESRRDSFLLPTLAVKWKMSISKRRLMCLIAATLFRLASARGLQGKPKEKTPLWFYFSPFPAHIKLSAIKVMVTVWQDLDRKHFLTCWTHSWLLKVLFYLLASLLVALSSPLPEMELATELVSKRQPFYWAVWGGGETVSDWLGKKLRVGVCQSREKIVTKASSQDALGGPSEGWRWRIEMASASIR